MIFLNVSVNIVKCELNKMKISLGSDLHLEWNDLSITECDAEIVILPGDLGSGIEGVLWAIREFNKFPNVILVIIVPGNHDCYGCDNVYEHIAAMKAAAEGTKVRVLYNDHVDYNGYRFIGATLWSDFKLNGNQPLCMLKAMAWKADESLDAGMLPVGFPHGDAPAPRVHAIADFDKIGWVDGKPITAENMLAENAKSVDYIFANQSEDLINVVVTHFPPAGMISFRGSFSDEYRRSSYYTNTLDNAIGYSNIKFWFYGHNHDNGMFEIGETTLVGWMRGYKDPVLFNNEWVWFKFHDMEI